MANRLYRRRLKWARAFLLGYRFVLFFFKMYILRIWIWDKMWSFIRTRHYLNQLHLKVLRRCVKPELNVDVGEMVWSKWTRDWTNVGLMSNPRLRLQPNIKPSLPQQLVSGCDGIIRGRIMQCSGSMQDVTNAPGAWCTIPSGVGWLSKRCSSQTRQIPANPKH